MTVTSRIAAAAFLAACACKADAEPCPGKPCPNKAQPQVTGHSCNLGVFTPAEGQRMKELVPRVAAATFAHEELADGYAFKIHGSVKELGEWLDGVRRCCPTIAYQLDLAPQLGDATLKIIGPADAKAFIREEFAVLIAHKS